MSTGTKAPKAAKEEAPKAEKVEDAPKAEEVKAEDVVVEETPEAPAEEKAE